MTPSWALSLVRQLRPTTESLLLTLVEFIAHSWVQTSLNSTAPVSRYSLVRHVVVAAVAGVETGATVAAPASCAGGGVFAALGGGLPSLGGTPRGFVVPPPRSGV